MAILEEIVSGFEAINVTPSQQVLEKCKELCINYSIDPEDFIDQWMAYTASNLNGAPPTLDALDRMERKELQKQRKTVKKTPKVQQQRAEIVNTTPVRTNLLNEFVEQSPMAYQLTESPSQAMVQASQSQLFTQRTDSRAVLNEFGDCNANTFKEYSSDSLVVKAQHEDFRSAKYMYDKLLLKRQAVNSITRWIVSDIINHHKLEISQEKLKDYSGEMVICGRVYSDSPGKLNVQSILLEGILEMYKGHMIKLYLEKLDTLALFNGEVIVVKGYNMKNRFVATEIYSSAPLPPPEKPITLQETVQIVAAAGPFTLPDNLLYEPLEDLLKYVIENKPNLLILMGPFVEENHPILEKTNECYDSFFESIVNTIMERLGGTGVRVVLVPSHKDAHNQPIFPCAPFELRRRYENLVCAPNPFILEVEGLTIGGSTADILFHLNKSEIFKNFHNKSSDRLARLASYLFSQRSFYPLYPPDLDVKIDYQLLDKYGMIENSPHVMFLPSNFKHFVKKIEDCVVVNPERLIKGVTAGTFARMEVRPGSGAVSGRISCQILRV